jgi:hypothetical protein
MSFPAFLLLLVIAMAVSATFVVVVHHWRLRRVRPGEKIRAPLPIPDPPPPKRRPDEGWLDSESVYVVLDNPETEVSVFANPTDAGEHADNMRGSHVVEEHLIIGKP